MAYATPTDLAARYDIRRIKDLLSDTGTPVADITVDATLPQLLDDATQMIFMACRVARRYTKATLDALYNSNTSTKTGIDPQSRQQLIRLVCDLAYGLLVSRRGLAEAEVFALAPRYKSALETIELLKHGERIFDDNVDELQDQADAGVHVDLLPPDPFVVKPWTKQMTSFFGDTQV